MSCKKCEHLNRGKDGKIINEFEPSDIDNFEEVQAAADRHNATCSCTPEGRAIRQEAYLEFCRLVYPYTFAGGGVEGEEELEFCECDHEGLDQGRISSILGSKANCLECGKRIRPKEESADVDE